MSSREDVDAIDTTAALEWAAGVVGPIVGVDRLVGGWTSTMLCLRTQASQRVVLRLMTREPWRTHGAGLTTRESLVQGMLGATPIPAPRSLALDADGAVCGYPAHLMSLLPGRLEPAQADPGSLDQLAGMLAGVHATEATIEIRDYEAWAWEAKYTVPDWAADPEVWTDAFAVLRSDAPQHETCFIHRDFGPRNILWADGEITGVVDWVETSLGPPWLDVAHCATNIALTHGNGPADQFAAAYRNRTGREDQPYFDVMDIVGFLPPPDREGFITAPRERAHLEARLVAVMQRLVT